MTFTVWAREKTAICERVVYAREERSFKVDFKAM